MARQHTHVTRGSFLQAVQSEDGTHYTVTHHDGRTETVEAKHFDSYYEPIVIQPSNEPNNAPAAT